MKKLILFGLMLTLPLISFSQKSSKLSEDEMAKMTPEQRIAHENDRKAKTKSGKKKKKEDTTKDKVKRAKKQDKKARKVKQPKQPKRSKPK